MKIREWICEHEAKAYEDRANKLEEIGAPKIVIDSARAIAEDLRNGKVKVGGKKELLETEVERFENCKSSGGKFFIEFNGHIDYYPQAKYGRFITEAC